MQETENERSLKTLELSQQQTEQQEKIDRLTRERDSFHKANDHLQSLVDQYKADLDKKPKEPPIQLDAQKAMALRRSAPKETPPADSPGVIYVTGGPAKNEKSVYKNMAIDPPKVYIDDPSCAEVIPLTSFNLRLTAGSHKIWVGDTTTPAGGASIEVPFSPDKTTYIRIDFIHGTTKKVLGHYVPVVANGGGEALPHIPAGKIMDQQLAHWPMNPGNRTIASLQRVSNL